MEIKKKKRKTKIREDDYLLEKRICAHKRPHFIPNPSLKFLTGPWHSESADTDFPIQTGSWQKSEASKMSILEPHPDNAEVDCAGKESLPHIHLFIFL